MNDVEANSSFQKYVVQPYEDTAVNIEITGFKGGDCTSIFNRARMKGAAFLLGGLSISAGAAFTAVVNNVPAFESGLIGALGAAITYGASRLAKWQSERRDVSDLAQSLVDNGSFNRTAEAKKAIQEAMLAPYIEFSFSENLEHRIKGHESLGDPVLNATLGI